MGAQLSLKVALPLAEMIATASDRSSKTGPSDAIRRHGTQLSVGSGNGLVPSGTKSLPASLLI